MTSACSSSRANGNPANRPVLQYAADFPRETDIRSDWGKFPQDGQFPGVLQQVQGETNDLMLELRVIGFAQGVPEAKWQTQTSWRSHLPGDHLQHGERNRGNPGLFNHACNQSDRLMAHRSDGNQKHRV